MADARPRDERSGRSEREQRRPRSRSPSDSAEEARRQRRHREREGPSASPRDRRRDDKHDERSIRNRSSRRPDDRQRDRDAESSRDRRHRDRGERHTSHKHEHVRRTLRDGDRHHESRHRRHHSRSPRRRSKPRSRSPSPKIEAYKKASGPLPDQDSAFSLTTGRGGGGGGQMITHDEVPVPVVEKQIPNFAPTGLLAAATNTIEKSDGSKVVLKYHEPAEARKPSAKDAWKLFIFKGEEIIDTVELGERSCWLVGRDVSVVDIPAEHPSVSKQHAVVQFRYTEKRNEYGERRGRVKPYLLDLESANGTWLNGERVEESRFVEIRDKDLIKFGESTREYVVMLPPKE